MQKYPDFMFALPTWNEVFAMQLNIEPNWGWMFVQK